MFKHKDGDLFTVTYGELRDYGEECSDVKEWLQSHYPEVFAEDTAKPIILLYYPPKTGSYIDDYPTILTNAPQNTNGWDAGEACRSFGALDTMLVGKRFRGWHLGPHDSAADDLVETILGLIGS